MVYNAADATVFLPRLLPAMEKASQTIPDPEARAVVEDAHKALEKLGADGAACAPHDVLDQQVRVGTSCVLLLSLDRRRCSRTPSQSGSLHSSCESRRAAIPWRPFSTCPILYATAVLL